LKVKGRNLYEEIETAVEAGKVRSDITSDLHSVREGGNLAAHPFKSETTGEIVPVAPGDAEYLLTVLEMLFDELYVGPAKRAKARAALNAKVEDARKKP
jgi:hypothetical protein